MGFGSAELPDIVGVFREICAIETHDGVLFQPDTVHAAEIRKEANYAGVRVMLLGVIDGARCQIQIDIGFGDAVTPCPEDVLYPVMLSEFEAPKLRVYPRYTVVAKKFEALSSLGIANSRMKVLARGSTPPIPRRSWILSAGQIGCKWVCYWVMSRTDSLHLHPCGADRQELRHLCSQDWRSSINRAIIAP